MAKAFLKLVDKLFSRNPKLKKIFNRDKMKVSYSWMRNIGSRKSQDTIEKDLTQTRRRKSENATVQETLNVLLMDIVWPRIRYIRVKSHRPAELRFKRINWPQRAWVKEEVRPSKILLLQPKFENSTEISKGIWRIKDQGGTFDVKWSVVEQASSYNPSSKRCHFSAGPG